MNAETFKASLLALWGPAWRDKAPEAFDTTISTLDRWANEHAAVPGPAGRLMEKLLADEEARKIQRAYERAYKQRKRRKA